MNVIAIISEPDKPNPLTESNYNRITQRSYPYVQSPKGQLNSYALCPECGNAVVLINKARTETQAEVLYARHVTYDVPDLANYDEQAYDDCILANPVNMDNKVRRRPGKKTNQIKQIFMNYFDLIVNTLETNLGVQFSDEVIENMVSDFCLNRGYEYRSVSVFNLPLAFAYMVEAQDLYGCRVSNEIALAIKEHSQIFNTTPAKFGSKNFVRRNERDSHGKLRMFFSKHVIPRRSEESNKEFVNFVVAELEDGQLPEQGRTIFTKKIFINKDKFYNSIKRRERYIDVVKRFI